MAAALILAAVAAWWLVAVWKPAPPRELKMATGPAGSAYAEYGARYRERLARSGIQLTLVPTEGAVANLALLRDAVSGVVSGRKALIDPIRQRYTGKLQHKVSLKV